jgi:hypothetical protein
MKMYKHPYYSAFNDQRQHAKRRGIDWHFDFNTWLEWWGEDITKRGRNKGNLCMARNGDIGPYHPNNVSKISCEENISQANIGKGYRKGIPQTDEHRAKNSAAQKIIHAQRKIIKETELCL